MLLGVVNTGCSSQSQSSIDKVAEPIINSFFKGISNGEITKSLVELLSNNENINLQDSATISLQEKFNMINEAAGAYMGSRLLKKRNIENDISIYSYLVKYEKKFYRFVFMFYNNGKRTKIYKFLYDDSIDVELEESLKLYVN